MFVSSEGSMVFLAGKSWPRIKLYAFCSHPPAGAFPNDLIMGSMAAAVFFAENLPSLLVEFKISLHSLSLPQISRTCPISEADIFICFKKNFSVRVSSITSYNVVVSSIFIISVRAGISVYYSIA